MYLIRDVKQKPGATNQKSAKTSARHGSFPRLASGSWLLASLAATGCVHRRDAHPFPTVEAVQPDEAMQRRDWAQSTATYPNGAVAAGPTEFQYETDTRLPVMQYNLAESATFLGNLVLLPYNLYKHPPDTVTVYHGEVVSPTSTAQPILPAAGAVQPSTPPVIENPGAQPSTPKVVEPGAMAPPAEPSSEAKPEVPAQPAAPETAPTTPAPQNEPMTPAPSQAPSGPAAPAPQASPAPAPAPETAPAPAPAPAPEAAPAPPSEPAPRAGEVAPSTPR